MYVNVCVCICVCKCICGCVIVRAYACLWSGYRKPWAVAGLPLAHTCSCLQTWLSAWVQLLAQFSRQSIQHTLTHAPTVRIAHTWIDTCSVLRVLHVVSTWACVGHSHSQIWIGSLFGVVHLVCMWAWIDGSYVSIGTYCTHSLMIYLWNSSTKFYQFFSKKVPIRLTPICFGCFSVL